MKGSAGLLSCGCTIGRRGLLRMAGGAIAAAAAPQLIGAAPSRQIIDVHSHYEPPELLKAIGAPPAMAGWSLSRHLDAMGAAGVSRSILSLTTPGVTLPGLPGQTLIRAGNDFGARLAADHPMQLALFAHVRLDEPDAALAEITRSFDTLQAVGVGVFTSYGNRWLGDPAFDPVFEELNRRSAIVYVHPTSAPCCRGLLSAVPDTAIEYGTDTSRAIANYVYAGAAKRFSQVRMIWSHAGGTMPFLIERFRFLDQSLAANAGAPEGFQKVAGRFFYDVAQASNPVATEALRRVIPMSRILFGTDYPFRTPQDHVTQLEGGGVFTQSDLKKVYRGNVLTGLPELAGTQS